MDFPPLPPEWANLKKKQEPLDEVPAKITEEQTREQVADLAGKKQTAGDKPPVLKHNILHERPVNKVPSVNELLPAGEGKRTFMRNMLSRDNILRGIVFAEIIGPPRSRKKNPFGGPRCR